MGSDGGWGPFAFWAGTFLHTRRWWVLGRSRADQAELPASISDQGWGRGFSLRVSIPFCRHPDIVEVIILDTLSVDSISSDLIKVEPAPPNHLGYEWDWGNS